MRKWIIDIQIEDYDLYRAIEENLDNPHYMRMLGDEDYFVEHSIGILEGVRPRFARGSAKID